ncbi:hypothetical protein E4T43_03097 [Aureobasidium subglaciale]|nr:hypothetical protein E4T43_03097 [Aureobasidium subglaciale]
MASWMPAYFQKRLLRAALSRIALLDVDSLDLDSLGVKIGRTSTVELKNVGLHVQELSTLLQLPPNLRLQVARVLSLRLTVPANFFQQSIIAEVDGVEVQVSADLPAEPHDNVDDTKPPDHRKKSRRIHSPSPPGHDSGGLPSTQRLARSILLEEPDEEKQELEARYMEKSSMTGTGDDLGTGTSLGLPGMVAGFLQGIVDRVQIRIKDVNLRLMLQDSTPEASHIAFIAHIATINVNAAAASAAGLNEEASAPARKRRRIALNEFSIHLVREEQFTRTRTSVADLFTSYTSESTRGKERQKNYPTSDREPDPAASGVFSHTQFPAYSYLSDSDHESLPDEMTQSNASFDIRPGEDNVSWASRRSQNSSGRDQIWSSFAPEGDQAASEMLQDMSSSVFLSTIDTRESTSAMSESTIGQSFTSAQAPQTASSSRYMYRARQSSDSIRGTDETATELGVGNSPTLSLQASEDGPDLSESVVYSHAEAESMYMSAVGQAPDSPNLGMVPGAWNSVIDDDEDLDPPFLSQHLVQQPGYESEDRSPTPRLQNQSEVSEGQNTQGASLTFVSKEILTVREMTFGIWQAPSNHLPMRVPDVGMSQSSVSASGSQPPGAFSDYVEGGRSSMRFNPDANRPDESYGDHEIGDIMDTTIELDISPTVLQFDADTIRSLITLTGIAKGPRRAPAPKRGSEIPPTKKVPDARATVTGEGLPSLSLRVTHLRVSLFEDLPDASVQLESLSMWRPRPYSGHEKRALLQLELQQLDLKVDSHPLPMEFRLTVEDLTFTAGTNDMVSFDRRAKQYSARGVTQHAILVETNTFKTEQGGTVRRLLADLLPIRIDLDLARFDEDFDALGGSTGIVEMSSSLLSSGYFSNKQESPAPQRRSVRFQESVLDDNNSTETKISAKIAAFDVRLASRSCSLELRASKTKIIPRQGAVRVSIDRLSLAMPTKDVPDRRSSFNIVMTDVVVTYAVPPSESDLERFIALVEPSNNKYEDADEVMVNTLQRQRRKGSMLDIKVETLHVSVTEWAFIPLLRSLGDELSKLSAVTKYLPEDDTPGLLCLVKVEDTRLTLPVNEQFGSVDIALKDIQAAHVGLPALSALSIGSMWASSGGGHDIIHETLPGAYVLGIPMVMARKVADEAEPVVRVKLFNICVEYDVPTLLSLTSTQTAAEVEQKVQDLATSVLDITASGLKDPSAALESESPTEDSTEKLAINVVLHDCAIGLQPRDLQSKGLLILKNTRFGTSVPMNESLHAVLNIRQATLYVADCETIAPPGNSAAPTPFPQSNYSPRLQQYLLNKGYVSVNSIRSAQVTLSIVEDHIKSEKHIDVEFRDEFFLLETCADSTQTLISILNGLSPPTIASNDPRFRTHLDPGLMTLDDMVNSFSGEAFIKPGPAPSALFDAEMDLPLSEEESLMAGSEMASALYEPIGGGLGFEDEDFYSAGGLQSDTVESLLEQDPFEMTTSPQFGDDALLRSLRKELGSLDAAKPTVISPFYQDDRQLDKIYGGSRALGEAHEQQKRFPIQVRVRDVNVIWNLYDGYDWRRTREALTQAVEKVEMEVEDRKSNKRRSNTFEDDDETVIGDCLFNSIYIGIPAAREPADIRRSISNLINQGNETASETESYATTGMIKPSSADSNRPKELTKKGLKLERGTSHKLGFDLKGVSLDFLVHPPGSGEVQSSVDVRVTDFEIFDHVLTSTWKKFLTLHNDRGKTREMMKPMIHLELLNVRPVLELVATEMIIRASVLPLRLHVDQDALEFMTRFFDFNDDSSKPADANAEPPFIQRLEVNTVSLCLDYKPKKVDYVGLRGGRMSEFKNFVTLEKADIKLKHAIIYGLRGFDTLHDTLSDIWTPDVIHNQLRGVLAGIGMTRPLVELGMGIRDIVAVPVAEIRKDGFKVRSVQKGTFKALSTTSSGFARLIAKVAIGTGTRLQEVEDMLSPAQRTVSSQGVENVEGEYEEAQQRQVSNYADQPLGVLQGLHSARRYLERDLTTARDAIIAIQGDFMASGTAAGAARAVARHAPTILLQPVIGVSRAVGQTFKGVGNQVDRDHIKKSEDPAGDFKRSRHDISLPFAVVRDDIRAANAG